MICIALCSSTVRCVHKTCLTGDVNGTAYLWAGFGVHRANANVQDLTSAVRRDCRQKFKAIYNTNSCESISIQKISLSWSIEATTFYSFLLSTHSYKENKYTGVWLIRKVVPKKNKVQASHESSLVLISRKLNLS